VVALCWMLDLGRYSALRAASSLTVFCIRLAKGRVPMVEMTHSPSTSSLGSEFNAFLFASIDEGAFEAPLSVVSALARLDLDPWQEAAELTRLPKETAAQRLGALLTLPGGDPAHSDTRTIAMRLVGLLPHPAGPAIGSSGPAGSRASVHINPTVVMMLFMALSVITMVISGFSNQPRLAPAQIAPASAPGATIPTPPPTKLQR
jgi:hypothetical protein